MTEHDFMKMLKFEKIAKTFEFSVLAHAKQQYGNLPYYTHCLDVVLKLPTSSSPQDNETYINEICAALLHDTLEDTPVTHEQLVDQFGQDVADTVAILTKDTSLTYDQNITRIINSNNMSAMRIKWADNFANLSTSKIHMTSSRRERLTAQYTNSLKRLTTALDL